MPQTKFIFASNNNLETKQAFYEFEDEKLSELLRKVYPKLNKQNCNIHAGSDVRILDWNLPISTLTLLGENILIYEIPYQMVSVIYEDGLDKSTWEFYVPSETRIVDLKQMIQNKTSINAVDLITFVKKNQNLFRLSNDSMLIEHSIRNRIELFIYSIKLKQIFIETMIGKRLVLELNPYECVENIKYIIEEKEGTPKDQQRLIFGGLQLDDRRTLNDYKIQNGDTVHFVLSLRGGGSGQFSFVDLANEKGPRKLSWSFQAPAWRVCRPGLSLEGKCKNRSCAAFNQTVIINMGFSLFHFGLPENQTNCPICNNYVMADGCGFNNCEWRFFGIQNKPGKPPKRVKSETWNNCDDNYYQFDQKRNGSCQWTSLAIETRGLDKQNRFEQIETVTDPSQIRKFEKIISDFKENKMRDYQVCSICYENYNNTQQHTPLMFPCQHTCCKQCVSHLYRNGRDSSIIQCPQCKKIHKISEHQLPKARFIFDYLDSKSI